MRLAAFHQIDRDAHRRVLLVAQRERGRLVHADQLARRVHAQARAGRRGVRRELGLDRIARADQHDVGIGNTGLELERRGHRDMGAVIAAHAVDREGDQRAYSPFARTTFLPR